MIRLAFYKAYAPGHPWWSWFVDKASGGLGFTHVEIVFDDGMSFSSSGMDPAPGMGGKPGVRAMNIDYEAHPERWRILSIFPTPMSEQLMRQFAEHAVAEGNGYDWGAVYRFVWPFSKENPNAYMCSEFCLETLRAAGLMGGPPPSHRVSPNLLFKMLGGRA